MAEENQLRKQIKRGKLNDGGGTKDEKTDLKEKIMACFKSLVTEIEEKSWLDVYDHSVNLELEANNR